MGRGWGGRGQYQVCDQGAVAIITRSTSLVTTNSRNTGIVIPDLIQTIAQLCLSIVKLIDLLV